MSKWYLSILVFLNLNMMYCQDIDLVVNTNNDSICAVISEVSSTQIVGNFYINGRWFDTWMMLNEVESYHYNAISKKEFLKQYGTGPIPYNLDLIIKKDSSMLICKIIEVLEDKLIIDIQLNNSPDWVRTNMDMEDIEEYSYNKIHRSMKYIHPRYAFFIELIGKGYFSLNADFRINDYLRLSLGLTSIEFNIEGTTTELATQNYLSVSTMAYILAGQRASKLEIGAGFSIPVIKLGDPVDLDVIYTEDSSPYALHAVIGYRYQKKNGLFFRAGFTPFYQPPDEFWPLFGLSFGFSR